MMLEIYTDIFQENAKILKRHIDTFEGHTKIIQRHTM